jgi:hypothetical protein
MVHYSLQRLALSLQLQLFIFFSTVIIDLLIALVTSHLAETKVYYTMRIYYE